MKTMTTCELCKRTAQMHCESDQASLCWDCDAAVHSANFLVARHSRNLLCRVCQSPTPWSAAGAVLRPILSACEKCVDRKTDCDEEEHAAAEEVVEENHVVPWSLPPPPEEDSSSSGGEPVVSRKRLRELDLNLSYEDNDCIRTPLSMENTTPLRKVQRFDLNVCNTC